jgi:hypothetical protein
MFGRNQHEMFFVHATYCVPDRFNIRVVRQRRTTCGVPLASQNESVIILLGRTISERPVTGPTQEVIDELTEQPDLEQPFRSKLELERELAQRER